MMKNLKGETLPFTLQNVLDITLVGLYGVVCTEDEIIAASEKHPEFKAALKRLSDQNNRE